MWFLRRYFNFFQCSFQTFLCCGGYSYFWSTYKKHPLCSGSLWISDCHNFFYRFIKGTYQSSIVSNGSIVHMVLMELVGELNNYLKMNGISENWRSHWWSPKKTRNLFGSRSRSRSKGLIYIRYFGIYHKELYSIDILCENSTSTMPVSGREGWVSAVCQAIYS